MSCNNLLSEAEAMQKEFIEIRRYLHSHAEVGFSLPHTMGLVYAKLREYGYAPERCGKAGITAVAGKEGKTFLLRADMDALPISEETELDFSAVNGNMHACGHDMHTAMLLCAAKLLKLHEAELDGTVKLMFQPAEETLSGAFDMLSSGVLDPFIHPLLFRVFKRALIFFPAHLKHLYLTQLSTRQCLKKLICTVFLMTFMKNTASVVTVCMAHLTALLQVK